MHIAEFFLHEHGAGHTAAVTQHPMNVNSLIQKPVLLIKNLVVSPG